VVGWSCIISDEHDDDVVRKFINESYHIENEYVMQLKADDLPWENSSSLK